MTKRPRRSRGSALLIALITALVLAIVGIALAYFSTTEDRISGTEKLQKEAFYAAETGLRAGETALIAAMKNNAAVTTLLTASFGDGLPQLDLHDGGYPAFVMSANGLYFERSAPVAGASARDQYFYTLYVRNNAEDSQGTATSDTDMRVNLVAVGYVLLANGERVTKILEEQIAAQTGGSEGVLEKQGNAGGTGGI